MPDGDVRRRRLVRALAIVATCGTVVFGLLAARLRGGAIDLALLVPSLERALSRPGSFTVQIGGAELEWDVRNRRIALRARDVRVVDAGGAQVATVPRVGVTPRVRALLRGTLALRALELIGPRLRIVRTADGGFDLGLGERERSGAGDMLQRLLPSRAPDAWLQRVAVRDAEIVAADPATGASWRVGGVVAQIEPADEGVRIALAGDLQPGEGTVPVRLEALYRTDPDGAIVSARFDPLQPAAVAALAPRDARAWFAAAALPVGGRLQLELDGKLSPRRVRLDAGGTAGTIALPTLLDSALAVRGLRMAAVLDLPADMLAVESLAVDLGEARVEIDGRLTGLRADRRVELHTLVSHLPAQQLGTYWPKNLARPARAWVTTRLSAGRVRDAALHLTGRLVDGGLDGAAVEGSVRFDGLAVRYLDRMPPARGIAGLGTVAGDRWTLRLARGAVSGLELAHGTVDLDVAARRGTIRAALRGPLAAALSIAERLRPEAKIGLETPTVAGDVAAEVRVDVPLRRVRAEDVGVAVSGRLTGVAVPRVLRGWSFSDGDLDLDLQGRSLRVAGHGRLEGVPVDVVWREDAARERRVDVTGRLEDAERAALGLDLPPFVDGPIGVRARLVDQRGDGSLDVDADLSDTTISLPLLAVAKPPGAPATAQARIVLAHGAATGIERFAFAAGGTSVTGRAALAADGAALQSLDAEATIAASAAAQRPGHLALAMRPAATGHDFVLTSDDAGALFRELGTRGEATGGRLRYAGTVQLSAPGTPIDGRLELHDFTLLRSPLLAGLATLGSLSGITDLLQSRGVRFERLDGGIAVRGSTLTVVDLLASGPSVNVLVSGTIDRANWTGSLHGTLVPSYYGLNTAGGRVPVLGTLATGKKGQGLQAFDFDVSGPLAAPRVSVNPLSSLAPGALRNLTRGRRGPFRGEEARR